MTVDASGFTDCEEEVSGYFAYLLFCHLERLGDARDPHLADETAVSLHEGIDILRIGRLADIVRHIDREEVGGFDEPVDVVEIDVVGIHEILACVSESLDGRVSFPAGLHRDRIHDLMLTVGLVPHRNEAHSEFFFRLEERSQLGDAFVGEAVADSE